MDADTCYGNQHDVEGRNFGKLAVIAPMLERIKLKEIINQHIPADVRELFDAQRKSLKWKQASLQAAKYFQWELKPLNSSADACRACLAAERLPDSAMHQLSTVSDSAMGCGI